MGALPKRKYAKARQGKRRSHLGLALPPLNYCPQCHTIKLSHHVCPTCGSYASRQVVEIEGSKKKTS
ncbi:MAG TPA: 50S ribosomal protein L32 [Dehalococcoidia bacterium]|jgi:large subunit ribosomal protein L32|nr:50S ribosomal protein L32 [Dehalococcoidia bacterium]